MGAEHLEAMETLFWQVVNRAPETEFIFGLFHWLLACLAVLVGWGLLRHKPGELASPGDRPLIVAFALLALAFALSTVLSGANFFFGKQWSHSLFAALYHGTFGSACLLVTTGLLVSESKRTSRKVIGWAIGGCGGIAVLLAADLTFTRALLDSPKTHSLAMLTMDGLSVFVVGAGTLWLIFERRSWAQPALWALGLLSCSRLVHFVYLFWDSVWSTAAWHAEQHLLSLSLFAFAWTLGERTTSLFSRVFVRLNLTMIVLASVTILTTVGMQRFQYLRLAEERSRSLAEFLRGHLIYYQERGDDLETILDYPDVLRRIVVGFGEIPDFRRVDITLGEENAIFRYAPDKTVSHEFRRVAGRRGGDQPERRPDPELQTALYRMLRIPVYPESENGDQIEFYGTFESINRHIGNYIVLIYVLFTAMAAAGVVTVGLIVRSADRGIQKQHRELEQAQEQLLQASKLASLGELAGGVAHEINNPVTSILSTASHLAARHRQTGFSQSEREQLDLVVDQAERIAGIVNKLLTFSRKSRMELDFIDVNEIVDSSLALMEFRLKGGKVTVKRDCTPELPRVLGDRERLNEVLVNLMNNALDAMPSGGVLSLRTAPTEGGVRIEVDDTGVGMDSALIDRIFDPFFTTKESGKGTGLGLSISHGIIKEHKGEIGVVSEPGAGTKFTVTLPRGASDDEETDFDH